MRKTLRRVFPLAQRTIVRLRSHVVGSAGWRVNVNRSTAAARAINEQSMRQLYAFKDFATPPSPPALFKTAYAGGAVNVSIKILI